MWLILDKCFTMLDFIIPQFWCTIKRRKTAARFVFSYRCGKEPSWSGSLWAVKNSSLEMSGVMQLLYAFSCLSDSPSPCSSRSPSCLEGSVLACMWVFRSRLAKNFNVAHEERIDTNCIISLKSATASRYSVISVTCGSRWRTRKKSSNLCTSSEKCLPAVDVWKLGAH